MPALLLALHTHFMPYDDPRSQASANAGWVVVSENVIDTVRAREGIVSVDAAILYSRAGSDGTYSLCMRACAGGNSSRFNDLRCHEGRDGNLSVSGPGASPSCMKYELPQCSACSEPLVVEIERPLPGAHPACANLHFGAFDADKYYEDLAASYSGHHEAYESRWVLAGLVVLVVMLVALLALRRLCEVWMRVYPACQATATGSVSLQTNTAEPEAARAGAMLACNSRDTLLDWLRFMSVISIAAHHIDDLGGLNASPRLHASLSLGVGCYPMLFLLAGFLAAIRTPSVPAAAEAVWPTLRMRVAQMYPMYLATALAGTLVAHGAFTPFLEQYGWVGTSHSGAISGMYILMLPFCAGAWHPLLRLANAANAPSFVVGALLFDGAFALPILSRLRQSTPGQLVVCLALMLVLTLWQAANDLDITVLVVDRYVTFLALGPSLASYVFGLALGVLAMMPANFGDVGRALWDVITRTGLTACLITVGLVGALSPPREEIPRHLAAWLRTGLFLPLFGAAVVATACRRDVMLVGCAPIWKAMGAGLGPLFRLWLPVLLCAHPAWQGARLLANVPFGFAATPIPIQFPWAVQWAASPPPPPPPTDRTSISVALALFVGLLSCGVAFLELVVRRMLCAPCIMLLDTLAVRASGVVGAVNAFERVFFYYAALMACFAVFLTATFSGERKEWALLADLRSSPPVVQRTLEMLSWVLLTPALALIMGLAGQIIYPPSMLVPTPAIPPSQENSASLPVLFWRIVTRGMHPDLVASNVLDAIAVLEQSALPRSRWMVEVVTDNDMQLAARTRSSVVEIVVPSTYQPPNGCKFKARALHYAAVTDGASAAKRHDWIIHMDEETRFNEVTVAHVLDHCMREHTRWVSGATEYGAIGQGVILYNVHVIESTICSLADTIRVGDDYGKFQLQYRVAAQPLIGMHGSFVVCQQAVELDFGFDHGMEGSITEDTFFAMHIAAHGVQVKWCHGFMYEQSPFSVWDFAKQRRRWYAGLWLCVRSPRLVRWRRAFLGVHVVSWALCPALNLLNWVNILFAFERGLTLRACVTSLYVAPCWGYLVGFWLTFSPAKLPYGLAEWLMLLFLQIVGIPVFAAMEAFAILLAICSPCLQAWDGCFGKREASSFASFAIVKKEGADAKRRAEEHHIAVAIPSSPSTPTAAESNGHGSSEIPVPRAKTSLERERYWKALLCDAPPAVQLPTIDPPPSLGSAPSQHAASVVPLGQWVVVTAKSIAAEISLRSDGTAVPSIAIGASLLAWVVAVHTRADDMLICTDDGQNVVLLRLHVNLEDATHLAQTTTTPRVAAGTDGSALSSMASLALDATRQLRKAAEHDLSMQEVLACGSSTIRASPQTAVSLVVSARHPPLILKPLDQPELLLSLPQPGVSDGGAKLYFDPNRLSPHSAARYAEQLSRAMSAASDSSNAPLASVTLASAEELGFVTLECNTTAAPPTSASTVHEAVTRMAAMNPNAVALCSHEGAPLLTYAALDARTNSLIHDLLKHAPIDFTASHRLIGVIMERSVAMVAAILAVLKMGGAYLPIDPSFPQMRTCEMLREANVAALFTGKPEELLAQSLDAACRQAGHPIGLVATITDICNVEVLQQTTSKGPESNGHASKGPATLQNLSSSRDNLCVIAAPWRHRPLPHTLKPLLLARRTPCEPIQLIRCVPLTTCTQGVRHVYKRDHRAS